MQRTLLSLAGRLDLLLAQAPSTGAAGAAAQQMEENPQVRNDTLIVTSFVLANFIASLPPLPFHRSASRHG
jgi:hypothetical protein